MDTNPVIETLGRRLHLAVIGGGPGSFIGSMHRTAARIDDRYEIVAGSLSSDSQRSIAAGRALGLRPGRCYGDGFELLDGEAARSEGAVVVAIMTVRGRAHGLPSTTPRSARPTR